MFGKLKGLSGTQEHILRFKKMAHFSILELNFKQN